jgi:hypothetical protein
MSEHIELQREPRAERHGFAVGDRVTVRTDLPGSLAPLFSSYAGGYGRIIHISGCRDGAFRDHCRLWCPEYQVDIIGGPDGMKPAGAQVFTAAQLAHAD